MCMNRVGPKEVHLRKLLASVNITICFTICSWVQHKALLVALLTVSLCVKTNKMTCATSEDSDQPGQPPCLIRVFTVRLMGS